MNEPDFDEQLLGMQGFTAARAERYRAEMERLIERRLGRPTRWSLGVAGVLLTGALLASALLAATARDNPLFEQFPRARWALVIASAIAGLLLGAWTLPAALRGRYARQGGDWLGAAIGAVGLAGLGIAALWIGWDTPDAGVRLRMIIAGATCFTCVAATILLTVLLWMHRRTHISLLRIEYRLAELLERSELR